MPLMPAVVMERVTRRFPSGRGEPGRDIVALDGVSLTVAAGGIFGLLGPNGAGKTTLLRLVSTLLSPSRGRIAVLGRDTRRYPEEVRRRIGAVLGGERSVYWRLSGRENLLYAGALHDLPPRVAAGRADELLRMVALTERADDLVERYSSGMRQRLALARALVHDPALLILDEPTAGMDPQAAAEVRALLAALARDGGRTVLIATHNLDEADRLCGTVAILDRGCLVALDRPGALKARLPADERTGGGAPTLEAVFMALTGRSLSAADQPAWPQ
ncbi:MAG: ABC transporter ATP-binding protein [Armatimonadetes bacterium]|nr:ABC transporter ATP-binding protein [Armatimonadota bacterium]